LATNVALQKLSYFYTDEATLRNTFTDEHQREKRCYRRL